MRKNLGRTFVLIFLVVLGAGSAIAEVTRSSDVKSARSFVYHGKLVRPDGSVPNGSLLVTVKLQSPEPSQCLLWAESQTITAVNGAFSMELGHTVHRISGNAGGAAADFRQAFINNPGLVISSAQCASGSSYTPTATDDRLLSVSFNDHGVIAKIDDLPIKSVPFALQAEEIGGYGLANLAKISGAGSSVIYTPAEVQSLKDMLGGDIAWDMKSRKVRKVADPVANDDAATMGWVLSQISSSGGGSVSSVGFAAPSIFTVSGSPVTASGTISLSLANQAANSVFAGPTTGVAANPSFRTLVAADIPALDASKVTMTTGKILGRTTAGNGSVEELTVGSGLSLTGGVLSATATGAVTSVTSGNGYATVTNGTTTPTVTINVGTAANTVAAGNDARITGALQKSGDAMTGTLQLAALASDPSTAGWTAADKGKTWFNTTSNQVKYWDGGAVQALGVSGAGLTSLGGQSGNTQTFAAGSAGNAPAISSSANVHTLNVPLASAGASVTSGTISNADYVAFNGKLSAVTNVASLANAKIWIGDAGGKAQEFAVSGDAALTAGGVATVNKIKGTTVSAVPTTAGQVLRYDGTNYTPNFIAMTDLRSNVTGSNAFASSCAANQTLVYNSVGDVMSCSNIAIANTQVSGLGALATKSTVDLSTSDVTGTLAAASFPALTGAVTTTAGSLATTLSANAVGSSNITDNSVSNADLRQGVARSVIGVAGNATANVADIQGTTNQVLRVDGAGTGLSFGAINLASSAAVSGVLAPANMGTGTADSTKYLRGDGSWQTLPSGADNLGNHVATQNLDLANYKLVGNGGTNGISISNIGNVGIGTTSPSVGLQVASGSVQQIYAGTGAATTTGGYGIIVQSDTSNGVAYIDTHTQAAGANLATMVFRGGHGASETSYQRPILTMKTDNGNVGIGTTSPGYKLDVAGDVNVTGNFKINGVNLSAGGGSMSSLNGSTQASQSFATPGSSGAAPGWSTNAGTGVHTLNIPMASATSVTAGLLSKTDYDAFTAKQSATLASGQVWVGNGSNVATAGWFGIGQMRNNVGTLQMPTSCTASQTLTWSAVTDVLVCSNIAVGSSNITDNSVANADLRQGVARSVIGVSGNATANVADIQGTMNQVLRVDSAGTGLSFGAINLASTAAVSGVLAPANLGTGTADTTKYLRGDGSWQTLPAGGSDDLGNHTATQNLNLASFRLVGNGGSSGISISSAGNVGIGTVSPVLRLAVVGDGAASWANSAIGLTDIGASGRSYSVGSRNGVGFHIGDETAGASRLVINSSGNVGISTTAPRADLDVNGAIISRAAYANTTGPIDYSVGNMQYTTNSCGAFALHNLKDGGTYMFVVQGTTVATCSFTAYSDAGTTALTVHLPPDHGATTNAKHTMYNIAVFGAHAYFAWTPGY